MTKAKLLERTLSGETFVVGEYLSGRIDVINIRDKTNGNFRKGYIRRETIITGNDAVVVGGFLSDGDKGDDFRPSAKKGERVCASVTKLETIQGFKLYGGTIEMLND